MGRSVVRAGAERCHACCLPPRWCVCGAVLPPVRTRLGVHVLIHEHEYRKPSSTGRLIARVVEGSVLQVYRRESEDALGPSGPIESSTPERELWILHPSGETLPAELDRTDPLKSPCALLLDGTWRQAHEMLRSVQGAGRCVRLPDHAADGPSRYWLRDQAQSAKLSTAEALMGLLEGCHDTVAAHRLRLHFELHVYATLRSRGKREMAERYLGCSPLLADASEAIDRLHAR